MTRALESRYKAASPAVYSVDLPWIPQCSILEDVFINTKSLGTHKTIAELCIDHSSYILKGIHLLRAGDRCCEQLTTVLSGSSMDTPGMQCSILEGLFSSVPNP